MRGLDGVFREVVDAGLRRHDEDGARLVKRPVAPMVREKIPAFAGMTVFLGKSWMPAFAGMTRMEPGMTRMEPGW
jgi:hypothetical protein